MISTLICLEQTHYPTCRSRHILETTRLTRHFAQMTCILTSTIFKKECKESFTRLPISQSARVHFILSTCTIRWPEGVHFMFRARRNQTHFRAHIGCIYSSYFAVRVSVHVDSCVSLFRLYKSHLIVPPIDEYQEDARNDTSGQKAIDYNVGRK